MDATKLYAGEPIEIIISERQCDTRHVNVVNAQPLGHHRATDNMDHARSSNSINWIDVLYSSTLAHRGLGLQGGLLRTAGMSGI